MSEHKHVNTRYWKRTEPDSTVVYFFTESNAAHARAEDDSRAEEIEQAEYTANVPEEARQKPYDATNGKAVTGVAAQGAAAVIESYKARCAAQMIGAHQQIIQLLLSADITHAERVFILEMVKAELVQSMLSPVPQQPVH